MQFKKSKLFPEGVTVSERLCVSGVLCMSEGVV